MKLPLNATVARTTTSSFVLLVYGHCRNSLIRPVGRRTRSKLFKLSSFANPTNAHSAIRLIPIHTTESWASCWFDQSLTIQWLLETSNQRQCLVETVASLRKTTTMTTPATSTIASDKLPLNTLKSPKTFLLKINASWCALPLLEDP